jgi:hypothetical protein
LHGGSNPAPSGRRCQERIRIADADGNPVPDGVAGEVLIAN